MQNEKCYLFFKLKANVLLVRGSLEICPKHQAKVTKQINKTNKTLE